MISWSASASNEEALMEWSASWKMEALRKLCEKEVNVNAASEPERQLQIADFRLQIIEKDVVRL